MKKLSFRFKKQLALILFSLIFLVGLDLRVYQFGQIPAGLHQDEISAAYETISLTTTGADRWGEPWPAYFLAWGSGQNVLLSYLNIPVFLSFGVSEVTIRLLPLLFSVALIPLVYWITKKLFGLSTGLWASLLVSVAPLLVIAGRWAVESNLLIFFQTATFALMLKSLDQGKLRWIIAATVMQGLSGYAYLPGLGVGVILWLVYFVVLIRKKYLSWKQAVPLGFLMLAFWFPLLLVVIKNYLVHETLGIESVLPFSIPLFSSDRIEQTAGSSAIGSLVWFLRFIWYGFNDFNEFNVVPVAGGLTNRYLFLVLAAAGLIAAIVKRKTIFKTTTVKLFAVWLSSAVILYTLASLVIIANVNRVNGLYGPLILLAAVGANALTGFVKNKLLRGLATALIIALILLNTFSFARFYFSELYRDWSDKFFFNGLPVALETVKRTAVSGPIFISRDIVFNYLQLAFYEKISPLELRSSFTGSTENPIGQFDLYIFDPALLQNYSGTTINYLDLGKVPEACKSEVVNNIKGSIYFGSCKP